MPIYATSYEPPSTARVDEAGRLIDDIWCIPKAPKQRVRGSSTLRDHLLQKVIDENLAHVRNHHSK